MSVSNQISHLGSELFPLNCKQMKQSTTQYLGLLQVDNLQDQTEYYTGQIKLAINWQLTLKPVAQTTSSSGH